MGITQVEDPKIMDRQTILQSFDTSLRQAIETAGNTPENPKPRLTNRFWPTEASALSPAGVVGKCRRCVYYSQQATEPSQVDFRGLGRMYLGHKVEDWLMESLRLPEASERATTQSVRVLNRNIKIPYKLVDFSDITISGEVDSIYEFKQNSQVEIVGGEIKSSSGYKFKNIVYHKQTIPGMPKIEHVLQVGLYLFYYRFVSPQDGISKFIITYYDRESCDVVHHIMELSDELVPIINGIEMKSISNGGNRIFNSPGINKVKTQRKFLPYEINIGNVFQRFQEIFHYHSLGILPPKDYSPLWSRIEIDKALNDGDLTASKLKEFEDGKIPYLCNPECDYCSFRKNCMEADKLI